MWEGEKGKGGKGGRGGVKVEGLGVGRVVEEKGKERVGRRVEGGIRVRVEKGQGEMLEGWEKEEG